MEDSGPGIGMFDRISLTYRRSDLSSGADPISVEGLFVEWDRSKDPTLVLKMDNGYNIGISTSRIIKIEVKVERNRETVHAGPEASPIRKGSIALLSMGGTISSRVDYLTGAVRPALSASDLAKEIRELGIDAPVSPRIVRSMLSEDVRPADWSVLANAIRDAFLEGAKGCVVAHGTDTLSLTASALSFLLKDLPGPVILVGSQRSSDRPSSDAFMNLRDAVIAAGNEGLAEVCVLMHGSVSDDATLLHRGNRVAKVHTSRRDAFRSVNSPPIGRVANGAMELTAAVRRSSSRCTRVEGGFDERVIVLRATPQLDDQLLAYASDRYRAILMEGTGLGHLRNDLIPVIERIVTKGVAVIMTSSCPFGMVDLNVYSTGRRLLEAGAIPAYDMTTDAAMVKAMYVLAEMPGVPLSIDEFRRRFLADIAGEITMRTELAAFGPHCSIDGPLRREE